MTTQNKELKEQSFAFKVDELGWGLTGYADPWYQGTTSNITAWDDVLTIKNPYNPLVEILRAISERFEDKNISIKEDIRALLDKTPNLDQVDISDELNMDLRLVSKMCAELLSEGKIRRKIDE
ncbi:MAG: hypothetical protein V1701_08260 [Planctomycetota bacterium]